MARCILADCELQKSKVTWRVIEVFAGSKRLKFTRQTAARIVRYFLYCVIYNRSSPSLQNPSRAFFSSLSFFTSRTSQWGGISWRYFSWR